MLDSLALQHSLLQIDELYLSARLLLQEGLLSSQ